MCRLELRVCRVSRTPDRNGAKIVSVAARVSSGAWIRSTAARDEASISNRRKAQQPLGVSSQRERADDWCASRHGDERGAVGCSATADTRKRALPSIETKAKRSSHLNFKPPQHARKHIRL